MQISIEGGNYQFCLAMKLPKRVVAAQMDDFSLKHNVSIGFKACPQEKDMSGTRKIMNDSLLEK